MGTGPPRRERPRSPAAQTAYEPVLPVVEPYTTEIRGLATYTIPEGGRPGERHLVEQSRETDLAANYMATNADRRRTAAARPQPLGWANVTVNLIEPETFFADRRNNLDFRVAKILRFGRTRTQVGLDIYNVTNTDVVTASTRRSRRRDLVADADGDSAGAVRQGQRAVRLLDRLWASGFRLGATEPGLESGGPALARCRASLLDAHAFPSQIDSRSGTGYSIDASVNSRDLSICAPSVRTIRIPHDRSSRRRAMFRFARSSAAVGRLLSVLLLLPSAASAQAAITGVVRDTSGGVLPGVTVEAASPVLIEKVRSVVSDDTGQYRIVDLRPGTYSVTFTLPGFSTVRREGIELSGTFVATVNGDLKVGALEETITVTGETPIVDVQSARVQQTVSKDILAAIPTSRNAGGIQALIPGMSTRRRLRQHHGGRCSGGAGDHPRRSRQRFAHLCRRHQHGVGRRQRGRREHAATWPARRKSWSPPPAASAKRRRPASSSTSFRARAATLQRPVQLLAARTARCRAATTPRRSRTQGLQAPVRAHQRVRRQSDGRRPDHPGQAVVLPRPTVRSGRENTVPGMWVNKNAGNPNAWTVDFDRAEPAFNDSVERNGIVAHHVAGDAAQQVQSPLVRAVQRLNYTTAAAPRRQTPEATAGRSSMPSHIQQPPGRRRSRAGSCWRPAGASTRRGTATRQPRNDGTHNARMIRVHGTGRRDPGPDLPDARGAWAAASIII